MKITAYVFAALLLAGAAYAKESDDASAAGNSLRPRMARMIPKPRRKPRIQGRPQSLCA